jgi:hypothetical protein
MEQSTTKNCFYNNGHADDLAKEGTNFHGNLALSYIAKMSPVNIEFNDLTYTVPTGRKGKYEYY